MIPTPTPPKRTSFTNLLPLGNSRSGTQRDCDDPTEDISKPLNIASESNAEATGFHHDAVRHKRGETCHGITSLTSETGDIIMATLRNKNKKKGFKQAMAGPRPAKILFDDTGAPIKELPPSEASRQVDVEAPSSFHIHETNHTQHVHLVPSEKQDRGNLPPRMFVTSVDVEAGMWDNRSRAKKARQLEEPFHEEGKEAWYDENLEMGTYMEHPVAPAPVPASEPLALNWDRVENNWDSFPEVGDLGQLTVGTVVGWKVCLLSFLLTSLSCLIPDLE